MAHNGLGAVSPLTFVLRPTITLESIYAVSSCDGGAHRTLPATGYAGRDRVPVDWSSHRSSMSSVALMMRSRRRTAPGLGTSIRDSLGDGHPRAPDHEGREGSRGRRVAVGVPSGARVGAGKRMEVSYVGEIPGSGCGKLKMVGNPLKRLAGSGTGRRLE